MKESKQVEEIVGLDLGHGETAVAKARLEGNAEPEMLEIHGKKNQITAIGSHPKRGIVIGEEALSLTDVTNLHICFKQKPTDNQTHRKIIKMFFEAYHILLTNNKQIEGREASHWFVGRPSGWSNQEGEEYQKLLKETGVPLINVVSESRGAFMQAKEAGKLTVNELKSSALIVDIGSSTTDFTFVKNLSEKPMDFGHNGLGAALIDKAILARTLASDEQKAELEAAFEQHPNLHARCELQCRKAKEKYFSNEEMYKDPEVQVQGVFERLNKKLIFEPIVNNIIVQKILNQPLPELNHKSWTKAFRETVSEVKKKLDQQGITIKVLLMTGGASRMKFTHRICEEIFPEAQFRPDSEPEFCIAKGLAYVGRWELRAVVFKEEIDELCSSKLPSIIKDHIPELIELLISPLVQGLIENAVKPGLRNWRTGQVRTLADLEPHSELLAKRWITSDEANQQITDKCVNWLSKIQDDLAVETDLICQKFHIPRSQLKLNIGLTPDDVLTTKLPIGGDPTWLNFLTNMVKLIVGLVIASLLGGGGIALLMAGPIGLVIGLLIGLGVGGEIAERAKEVAKEAIKHTDFPHWTRWFLWDSRINSLCQEMRPNLEKLVRKQLTNNQNELIEKFGQELKKSLHTKAEEVIILIQ